MTEKEPPPGEKDAETMGADDPYDLKGLLKRLGGSQSDHWNKVLIDQTVHTLGHNRPAPPGCARGRARWQPNRVAAFQPNSAARPAQFSPPVKNLLQCGARSVGPGGT
jgi:hypothetical protein